MKKVIFINSHPIQYFAPMYKYMTEQGIETSAWYCSDNSVQGGFDTEFGVNVKWDIPLLEGYNARFFRNNSWKPSHDNGFFGLINLGLIRELFRTPKSTIVVHGWHYCTLFLVLMLGKSLGHTICLRNDTPKNHEDLKTGWKQKLKRLAFTYLMFPRINYFMYIGTENRLFYQSYGLPDSRLVFCPYAVDNHRFQQASQALVPQKASIKQHLGIPADGKVILFSAKYIDKKRPLDLLAAFAQAFQPNYWLVFVGEGELRKPMEDFIAAHSLRNVLLTGFVNQSQIPEYYAISDVFVMCSTSGENWGLSANEAMNFDLPVILSDLTGCAADLVQNGVNGYSFATGNTRELATRLTQVLREQKLTWSTSSVNIIDRFSYDAVIEHIEPILR